MRADDSGVGGFVEDLPVLLFVLMGTLTVISTSVWVTGERREMRLEAEADNVAGELLEALLLQLSEGHADGISVSELRGLDASAVDGLRHDDFLWQLSIYIIHPWVESICLRSDDSVAGSGDHGYANRIINASYGADGCALVEVRCAVWNA
jgi:hypothetical protein